MICLVKAVGAWAVILYLSINLIGFVVRGFFVVKPEFADLDGRARDFLEHEAKKRVIAEHATTLTSIVAVIGFIGALAYYWNITLASVSIILMASRLPDLLWEIKNGKKITKSDGPKNAASYIGISIMFLCLPLTWFALCGS